MSTTRPNRGASRQTLNWSEGSCQDCRKKTAGPISFFLYRGLLFICVMNHSVENAAKKSNFRKFVLFTLSRADASEIRGAVTREEIDCSKDKENSSVLKYHCGEGGACR